MNVCSLKLSDISDELSNEILPKIGRKLFTNFPENSLFFERNLAKPERSYDFLGSTASWRRAVGKFHPFGAPSPSKLFETTEIIRVWDRKQFTRSHRFRTFRVWSLSPEPPLQPTRRVLVPLYRNSYKILWIPKCSFLWPRSTHTISSFYLNIGSKVTGVMPSAGGSGLGLFRESALFPIQNHVKYPYFIMQSKNCVLTSLGKSGWQRWSRKFPGYTKNLKMCYSTVHITR